MRFLEAESREKRRIAGGEIGEEDEATVGVVGMEFGEHLE